MDFDFTELRMLRIAANLKQTEVGKRIGVSAATVSNWENGMTDIPIGMLNRLMKLYHVGYEHFLVHKPERINSNGKN